jgi:hypothetical protein
MLKSVRRLVWGIAAISITLSVAWIWLTHRGVIGSAGSPIPDCRDYLARDIETRVRPVLVARQTWEWGPNYDALERLLADKTLQGLEARVALMAYDLGAHPDEELAESLLSQEQGATPIMLRYMQCRPRLEREWLIGTVRAGRGGYEAFFELLKEGRPTTK